MSLGVIVLGGNFPGGNRPTGVVFQGVIFRGVIAQGVIVLIRLLGDRNPDLYLIWLFYDSLKCLDISPANL